jgi:hypothetical protein
MPTAGVFSRLECGFDYQGVYLRNWSSEERGLMLNARLSGEGSSRSKAGAVEIEYGDNSFGRA